MQGSNVTNVDGESNGRREIDPVFKETVCSKFDLPGVQVQTQVEVGRLPRTIDATLTVELESDRERLRNETPFYYARTYNHLAFKGINDALDAAEFRLILGRANLYMGENDISAEEITITIVSSRKPVKLLKSKSDVNFLPTGRPGYYQSDNRPPVNLIVVNELDLIPKNYPLLLFTSSKKKFEEFLFDTVKNNCFDAYVEFAYRVNPEKTKEVIEMSGWLTEDKLQFMAKDIGPKLLPLIPVKDRLAGLTAEDRLAGLTAEDRLTGLTAEDRLAGLTAEDLRKRLKELENRGKN